MRESAAEKHLLRFHEQHLHNRLAALPDARWQYAASRHATRTYRRVL